MSTINSRPLIMKSKLPLSTWRHAILHATILVRIRPTSYNTYSPIQLAFGVISNIFHLKIFGCAVYVPIALPQRIKLGSQRKLWYVRYKLPSIIKYVEPLTSDLFTIRFTDCYFDKSYLSTLGEEKDQLKKKITWKYH